MTTSGIASGFELDPDDACVLGAYRYSSRGLQPGGEKGCPQRVTAVFRLRFLQEGNRPIVEDGAIPALQRDFETNLLQCCGLYENSETTSCRTTEARREQSTPWVG